MAYLIRKTKQKIKFLIIKMIETVFFIRYFFTIKKNIDYKKEFNNIALIFTSPLGLGDLVMVTPFMKTMRKNFPKAKITLITDKKLFTKPEELNNIIDKIIILNKKSLLKDLFSLRKKKYDLGIVMNRAINQSLYLSIINPRYRLGYLGGLKILSNFKLKNKNLFFTKKEHFSFMSIKIAYALGLKNIDFSLIKPNFDKKIYSYTKKLFNSLNLDKKKKVIIINPFTKWPTRTWYWKNYSELIRKLINDYNIILLSGPDGKETMLKIINELKKHKIRIPYFYNLSLKKSIIFLKNADLFIAGDCGPMHFALMMRVPGIYLFGPVNPLHRMPLSYKKKYFDYIWVNDFKPIKKLYNYEYQYINKELEGLRAIPVTIVENKIRDFFKKKRFY